MVALLPYFNREEWHYSFWIKRLLKKNSLWTKSFMMYFDGMRKLFKSCGSWNPGSFQITSYQVRKCVLCGWFESMLALTQLQLKRRTRIKNLCLKVRCSPRSKKEYG